MFLPISLINLPVFFIQSQRLFHIFITPSLIISKSPVKMPPNTFISPSTIARAFCTVFLMKSNNPVVVPLMLLPHFCHIAVITSEAVWNIFINDGITVSIISANIVINGSTTDITPSITGMRELNNSTSTGSSDDVSFVIGGSIAATKSVTTGTICSIISSMVGRLSIISDRKFCITGATAAPMLFLKSANLAFIILMLPDIVLVASNAVVPVMPISVCMTWIAS